MSLNAVPFISVDRMMKLINRIGIERVLTDLVSYIEHDFMRWGLFDKVPRLASHSAEGVIELMPTTDGRLYGFKYVNGHPENHATGRQTVAAFGMLADMRTGYPLLISEMTLLTALRTAATSALAARMLAPEGARCMAILGNGAQAEFQALAFKAILGIDRLRLYDTDIAASRKCVANLANMGFDLTICASAEEALAGASIITTATADKRYATILTGAMVAPGVHINAIGGDCPGKTELHPDVLARATIVVEYAPQTRVEGEIQQLDPEAPVTELWRILTGGAPGRAAASEITVFDSIGFAIEDFSALRYVRDQVAGRGEHLDLLADPDDPRDLFGMLRRAEIPERLSIAS